MSLKQGVSVYDGRKLVCEQYGHKLIVVYEDGYNALVGERDRYRDESDLRHRMMASLLNDKQELARQKELLDAKLKNICDPKSNRLRKLLGSLNDFNRRLWQIVAGYK